MTASAAAALVFGGAGVVPARAESLNAVLAQAASRVAGDVAVLPAAEGESVTVTTAQEFIDALTKGTAPIIKIGANIDLNDVPGGSKTVQNAINNAASKRSVVIESAEGGRYTLDFGTYAFNMGTGTTTNQNVTVTMKNLDLYGQNYYSMVSNAGTYNFENVTYTGSQMVYATKGDINYYGDVTAKSVVSFTNAATGKTYNTAGSGNQQVIEGGTAIFKAGSNVTLATEAGNVLEIKSGGSGVIVEEGANVTIAPRSKVTAEHPRLPEDTLTVSTSTARTSSSSRARP
ncbi:MAG: pectate lyase-like adhesive domain-containing protein [Collinsella sp.]|nr:pectate lyase-like adhesive domain-containing protein [Collinsella sp.]